MKKPTTKEKNRPILQRAILPLAQEKGGEKGGCRFAPRHKLSGLGIKAAAPGKHGDGGGRWLHKRGGGGLQPNGLKQVRDLADQARAAVARGLDPIAERERLDREAQWTDTTLP